MMNERIKALANEAGGDFRVIGGRDYISFCNADTRTSFDVQQFAELIVMECAKIADEVTSLNEKNVYQYSVAGSIKEHFGVE